MQERILALAMGFAGAGEEERERMTVLCAAEESAWRGRIREGAAADCGEAFLCAVAFAAAADFAESCGAESFTAGEISVKSGGQADALRKSAERLMAPYAENFCFKGVQG